MSYVKNFMTTRKPSATGGVQDWISAGKNILSSGANVLQDPALPAVVGLVAELKSIEVSKGVPGAASQPGIGLRAAVSPLSLFVVHKKNPWLAPVAVLAILGIPFFVGYNLGKSRKRAP